MDDTLKLRCGKMSPERSAQTKEKISKPSSKNSVKSATRPFLFLDLRTPKENQENGNTKALSWQTDFQSLGDFSMHNFGESPSVENESFLWQILEDNVPDKYSLSARACQGILDRAERKGKILDPLLKNALMRQIERERVISVENHPADSRVSIIEDGTVQTLTSRMGTGGGNVPLVMSFRKTGHPRSADEGQGWERTEKADTLNVFDNSENRTPILIVEQNQRERE